MIPLLTARIPPTATTRVAEVLASGYVGNGPVGAAFQARLAAVLGCPTECLVLTNGATSALALAARLTGARFILTTPMSFIASVAAVYQAGARPVWLDSASPYTCQVSHEDFERVFAVGPARWALLAVQWGGWSPRLDRLRAVADARGVPVILDAAQALGALYLGAPAHRYADYTAYSFSPTKHLTTGDGGALVCRDAAQAERARRLAWFGMRRWAADGTRAPGDQDVEEIGVKAHSNDLAAALGLAGLDGLEDALRRCRENAGYYRAHLEARCDDWKDDALETPSPWVYTIFVDDPARFVAHARGRGVDAGRPHRRLDAMAFARGRQRVEPLAAVDFVAAHYVCLPVGWWVTDADRALVVETVRAYPGEVY